MYYLVRLRATQLACLESRHVEAIQTSPNNGLPWYRHGMVWAVILLPLLVVMASTLTLSIASSQDTLVAPAVTTQAK